MNERNPYDVLGLARNSSQADVRSAYIKRTKVLHPDRFDKATQPVEWKMANEMLQELNAAYSHLRSQSPDQSNGNATHNDSANNSTDHDDADDPDEETESDGGPQRTTKREPNAAFMKPVTPDHILAAVVGSAPLPRTEIVSKMWSYIKQNNLQDKKVKTVIHADAKLRAIFDGRKSVTMFEMNKYVSGHLKA